MDQTIAKVKIKDDKTIVAVTAKDGVTESETVISSTEPRDPAFTAAFETIAPHFLNLLDLPKDYAKGLRISGVSFTWNDKQGMGAVITGVKAFEEINGVLVLNTPHFHEEIDEGGGNVFSSELARDLRAIEEHARAFIKGKRAQGNLLN